MRSCSKSLSNRISFFTEPFMSSLMLSRDTCLMATSLPFYLFNPLYTMPHDPRPITSPIYCQKRKKLARSIALIGWDVLTYIWTNYLERFVSLCRCTKALHNFENPKINYKQLLRNNKISIILINNFIHFAIIKVVKQHQFARPHCSNSVSLTTTLLPTAPTSKARINQTQSRQH